MRTLSQGVVPPPPSELVRGLVWCGFAHTGRSTETGTVSDVGDAQEVLATLDVTSLPQFSDWVLSLSLNTGTDDGQGTV